MRIQAVKDYIRERKYLFWYFPYFNKHTCLNAVGQTNNVFFYL